MQLIQNYNNSIHFSDIFNRWGSRESSGRVIDSNTNEALIGVNVMLIGTT
ncbi:MAG: hypothetical protein CM15mP64_4950 [Candidatus Neomarinimicrobiota bacterium]|nr:MAG: hypothetical protein CM15mP64_4950 [Candidatus Neomarinimicrobiota bacterium]